MFIPGMEWNASYSHVCTQIRQEERERNDERKREIADRGRERGGGATEIQGGKEQEREKERSREGEKGKERKERKGGREEIMDGGEKVSNLPAS